MSRSKDKAISVAIKCAKEYKENLLGRNLLFVSMNKHKQISCIEVLFEARHFQHLTGLKTSKSNISATDFFDRCIDKRLSPEDIEFADDGTTTKKLSVLPSIVKKNLSASMIGDSIGGHPKLITDKMAGSVTACIGFVNDSVTGRYVPNTVLSGDIRQNVTTTNRIILTYRKQTSEKRYNEIVFATKKFDFSTLRLPDGYEYLPIPANTSGDNVNDK